MVIQQRNQVIRKMREQVPELTFEQIGKTFGISKQRAQQLATQSLKSGIIPVVMSTNSIKIDQPMSATQASKLLNIPYSVISTWVTRGLVKVVSRPDRRACTGQPVLLDPISLQERIDRYRPHQKKTTITA